MRRNVTSSVVISVLALVFGVGSFWWIQARHGRLRSHKPRTYAGGYGTQIQLSVALILHNTGPAPIVATDFDLSSMSAMARPADDKTGSLCQFRCPGPRSVPDRGANNGQQGWPVFVFQHDVRVAPLLGFPGLLLLPEAEVPRLIRSRCQRSGPRQFVSSAWSGNGQFLLIARPLALAGTPSR
jgi:hypothetical protein